MPDIGIEWVKNYHGRNNDLANTQIQAEGFLNILAGTRKFNLGDDLAWDRDWEQQGVGSPAQGTDHVWADTVHIAFFSGHGGPGGFQFGIADRDDGVAKPSELQWGNANLNWAALDACNVLAAEGVFDRWRPAFKGLHYVLGWHTTAGDETLRGVYFAQHLNEGLRVRDAWIKAAQETEGADREWAYVRADNQSGTNTYDDQWPAAGTNRFVSADPATPPRTFTYCKGAC